MTRRLKMGGTEEAQLGGDSKFSLGPAELEVPVENRRCHKKAELGLGREKVPGGPAKNQGQNLARPFHSEGRRNVEEEPEERPTGRWGKSREDEAGELQDDGEADTGT